MTKTIIRSQHSGRVNFIIALFNLVSRIVLYPFAVFTSQIITKQNLLVHSNTGNKAYPYYNTIIFTEFCLAYPLAGELNT